MAVVRPNPLLWVWYVYGGRLPDRYREWVLRDNTGRYWLLRHAVRVLAQMLPVMVAGFVLLNVLTPAPAGTLAAVLCAGLLVGLFLTGSIAPELAEARLVKHGFPAGSGPSWGDRAAGR